MVTTRSGTSVRHHAVRFKKGAAVRRVLEYDEDGDWGYEVIDSDSDTTDSSSSVPTPTYSHTNGGILVNGTKHNTQQSTTNHSLYAQQSPAFEEDHCDITIPYGVEECRHGSWLWDALLFVVIILFCYTCGVFLYRAWGHGLYLTLATLCIVLFSYNVTYFDSTKPGILPPSPISPAKYRQLSGHTYHLTYLMSIVNGLVFLALEPYIRNIVVPPV